MTWEEIEAGLERAAIFGGWLVRSTTSVSHCMVDGGVQDGWDWRESITFVPDPVHQWALNTEVKE